MISFKIKPIYLVAILDNDDSYTCSGFLILLVFNFEFYVDND